MQLIPHRKGFLSQGKHKVYFATYGNPQGQPWLFCHGGPGFHSVPSSNLKFFDLKKHYVILFDQRGAGKSRPHSSVLQNTTQDLVKDMKSLLDKLNLKKVNLMGSSWGTTLALCFALEFPEMVNSLVLKGLFLGRSEDILHPYLPSKKWSLEQTQKFQATLGQALKKFKVKNLFKDSLKIVTNHPQAENFIKAWVAYEVAICQKGFCWIDFTPEFLKDAKKIATLELHYFKNHCFLPKNYILKNVFKIKHLPIKIVHGGEDMVTPKEQALILSKVMPHAELYLDPHGGHSSTPKMNAMIKAMIRKIPKI